MPKGKAWTAAEDAALRDAAANAGEGARHGQPGSRLRDLALRLGRSYGAVLSRASAIRARSFDPAATVRKAQARRLARRKAQETALDRAGFPRRHLRPWTPADDAALAAHAGDGSQALAVRLRRSRRAVQKRASRLGIAIGP